MTAGRSIYMDKKEILEILDEARERIRYYDLENQRNSKGFYDPGSVDNVALRILEKGHGVIFIGAKLNGKAITLHAREGSITDGMDLEHIGPEVTTYVLEGFRDSTTVSRFAHSICDVLAKRANARNKEISQLMMPNTPAFASRTQRELGPYLGL